jgi:hypothetical protein
MQRRFITREVQKNQYRKRMTEPQEVGWAWYGSSLRKGKELSLREGKRFGSEMVLTALSESRFGSENGPFSLSPHSKKR